MLVFRSDGGYDKVVCFKANCSESFTTYVPGGSDVCRCIAGVGDGPAFVNHRAITRPVVHLIVETVKADHFSVRSVTHGKNKSVGGCSLIDNKQALRIIGTVSGGAPQLSILIEGDRGKIVPEVA